MNSVPKLPARKKRVFIRPKGWGKTNTFYLIREEGELSECMI